MRDRLKTWFRDALPAVDFASLRYLRETDEILSVRQNVPEPVSASEDAGLMVTVIDGGGLGYAATSDVSAGGIAQALRRAHHLAKLTAGRCVTDFSKIEQPCPTGEYAGPNDRPWHETPTSEKFDILRKVNARMKTDDRIVDWEASFWHTHREQVYLTSAGGDLRQEIVYLAPSMSATANRGSVTQTRSLGSLRGCCSLGGMEAVDRCRFTKGAHLVAEEALELLDAPECPTGTMDVILAPDQMMLQIHESIGHPLEIDRILGDERNYAGTSFVTPDMFGSYQYGSELLNVTFDPTIAHQFASYGYDDDGLAAEKQFVIQNGILVRGLGGATSQARSGLPGVADSRASGWNRPPIDRMANLNVEPGDSTLAEMISRVERGVYMKTNRSWSIDDSRNKFQFGCEYGVEIRDGMLVGVVRNPNYRGVSATFWRSLAGVGRPETVGVYGTPYCGKGEPNQIIRVGHASPACLFTGVDVFGGA